MAKSLSALPMNLLLLDFVGALMVALGIVETTEPGAFLDPERLFPAYNWLLIVLGSVLMLPMVLHMIRRAKQQAAGNKVQTVERRKP